jgi:hypothetical protein
MTDQNLIEVRKERIKKLAHRFLNDFEFRIKRETDISVILLKGHLLIEYYLDQIILLFFDKEKDLRKLSFFEKIRIVEERKIFDKTGWVVDNIIKKLYAINNVRNNLAHDLGFTITESELDSIGYTFGREYVLKKFADSNDDKPQLNNILIWMIRKISQELYLEMSAEIMTSELKESTKETKQLTSPLNSGVTITSNL